MIPSGEEPGCCGCGREVAVDIFSILAGEKRNRWVKKTSFSFRSSMVTFFRDARDLTSLFHWTHLSSLAGLAKTESKDVATCAKQGIAALTMPPRRLLAHVVVVRASSLEVLQSHPPRLRRTGVRRRGVRAVHALDMRSSRRRRRAGVSRRRSVSPRGST